MRKLVLLLILGGLLLVTAGCGGRSSTGSANNFSKSITVSASVNEVITKYFDQYFEAERTSTYSNLDDRILKDNEDTKLFETFREMELARQSLFGEGISWYKYDIAYRKCSTSGDKTIVELTLNVKFHYHKALDFDSACGGINYSFTLKNNDFGLVITKIDSDLDIYEMFKTEVEEVLKQDGTLSKVQAIAKVKESRKKNLDMMRGNSLYLKGAATSANTVMSTESTAATDITTNHINQQISKSVYVTCKQYTYSRECAKAYAEKYYDVDGWYKKGIFDIVRNDSGHVVDCTNFVSQCVWAGYTGFNANDDIATAKKNISNRVGMVPTKWYFRKAGGGDYTSTWTGVKLFFEYMVTPKTIGPNATTDFRDYDSKHHYSTIPAASINVGDVIQLWDEKKGGYYHSIFITQKNNNTDNCQYSDLFYSAHTNNRCNKMLTNAVNLEHPHMRRLTPAATCYLKSE
jgi:hypothetical protein